MGTRKSKSISHFGCQQCKARKVKCDEGKPSCLQCARQRRQCVYSEVWKRDKKVEPSNPFSSETSLETVLLYQWMTQTGESLRPDSLNGFGSYRDLPEIGFKHRFLMDVVLLMAAAHLKYQNKLDAVTVEYYKATAVESFRKELSKGLTTESAFPLLRASGFIAFYWITLEPEHEMIQCQWSMLYKGTNDLYHTKTEDFWTIEEDLKIAQKLSYFEPQVCWNEDKLQSLHHTMDPDAQSHERELYHCMAHILSKLLHQFVFHQNGGNCPYVSWFAAALAAHPPIIIMLQNKNMVAISYFALFYAVTSMGSEWVLGANAWKRYLYLKQLIPEASQHLLDVEIYGIRPYVSASDSIVTPESSVPSIPVTPDV